MKKRLIVAVLVMIVGMAGALLMSYNLDCLLTGQNQRITANLFIAAAGLKVQPVRLFFYIFTAAVALVVFYMLFSHSYIKYKSNMQQITPDLQTPMAEGQGQYGTARWLSPAKYDEAFMAITVDESASSLRQLAQHGRDDLEGVK